MEEGAPIGDRSLRAFGGDFSRRLGSVESWQVEFKLMQSPRLQIAQSRSFVHPFGPTRRRSSWSPRQLVCLCNPIYIYIYMQPSEAAKARKPNGA